MSKTLRPLIRSLFTILLSAQLVVLSPLSAHAGSFGAVDYVAQEVRAERIERVRSFLAEERVAAQLGELGVDAADAQARIAALSDEELAQLDMQMDDMEAGAGVIGIIGAVFVVLIILELVGVTNVFTRF